MRSLEGRREVSEELVVVSRQRSERLGRVKERQEKTEERGRWKGWRMC